MAEQVTVTEPAVTIDRERRMVRNLVVKLEPAEPPIGQMQLDFLAQLPLKTDAVAVADNQHPDHQLGINRWPADLAVERHQLLAKLTQYAAHNRIDPAQQVARRNTPFEVEQVKQLALVAGMPTHHDPTSSLKPSTKRNHDSTIISTTFSTASVRNCPAASFQSTLKFPESCRACRPPSGLTNTRPVLSRVNWRP